MSIKKTLLYTCALLFCTSAVNAMGDIQSPTTDKEQDLSCIQRAQWIAPATRLPLKNQTLLKNAAKQQVVLLGEQHPDAVHHRWQLQTITQLYAHNPNVVIGFEMFPRRLQPVLEAWIRGELSEDEFLQKTDWDEVWKFDPDLYMPLFRFARMNRLPIVALNVEMDLIGAISQKGWDGVDEDRKEGVSPPRKAHPDYITELKKVFDKHPHVADDEKKDDQKSKARFQRFVEAQITWDGAMAQELARVQKMGGNPLVIGVMGSGHLADRYGVPYQLQGLGLGSTVLLPWTLGWNCNDLSPSYADAIFGLEAMEQKPAAQRPILGIRIEKAENKTGVVVEQVVEESIAEDAGLEKGDVILIAAGQLVEDTAQLIRIIQRQAPGTWLPLEIERNAQPIDIIAKFPNWNEAE
ncbi:MAG: ChaN family lipoprotein [Terasakiella sp.]|uniref:ChaN family lipoprotein n=1 Tax=unclassified Terasakiella TaxID=2614952 RepID=UPI003AFF6BA5